MSVLTSNGTCFHQEIVINSMYCPTSIENIGFNFIGVDIITEGISYETYLNFLIKCSSVCTLGSIFTVYNVMVLVV
jgi:hypothetical protein